MEIISNLQSSNQLEPQEILFFSNGIGRLTNMKNDTVNGMTVAEVIQIQKDFIKTINYNQLRETASRVTMNLNYDINFLGFNRVIDTLNKVEGMALMYEINNKSGKSIKSLTGMMQFYNRNNQLLKQFTLENPQELAPDAKLQFYKAFTFDTNNKADSLIRYHSNQMIIRWKPQTLEFSDGVKIEIK